MKYEDVIPIGRAEAVEGLKANDSATVCDALVRMTFHDPDQAWVESQLCDLSAHQDCEVRGLVATCYGHLARIHGILCDRTGALAVLERLRQDPAIAGRVEDAKEDMAMFLKGGEEEL